MAPNACGSLDESLPGTGRHAKRESAGMAVRPNRRLRVGVARRDGEWAGERRYGPFEMRIWVACGG